MLSSLIEHGPGAALYPEFADARVLVSGVRQGPGAAIAQAFAGQGARLAVQTGEISAAIDALGLRLAATARELAIEAAPSGGAFAAMRFAQSAARQFGGLDAAITLTYPDPGRLLKCLGAAGSRGSVEAFAGRTLQAASLVTQVAASRMTLTLTEGTILNAAIAPRPATRREEALLAYLRAALAAMTRIEARARAGNGIRVNALWIPDAAADIEAPGRDEAVTAFALYLASAQAKEVSGHIFDAEDLPADLPVPPPRHAPMHSPSGTGQ